MKTILFFLVYQSFALGAISLKIEVELDQQKLHHATVRVAPNEWTTIKTRSLELRLKASPAETAVQVDCEVSERVNGQSILKGKPVVTTKWGYPAEVSSHGKDKSLIYRFKVLPSKS